MFIDRDCGLRGAVHEHCHPNYQQTDHHMVIFQYLRVRSQLNKYKYQSTEWPLHVRYQTFRHKPQWPYQILWCVPCRTHLSFWNALRYSKICRSGSMHIPTFQHNWRYQVKHRKTGHAYLAVSSHRLQFQCKGKIQFNWDEVIVNKAD